MLELTGSWDRAARTGSQPTTHTLRIRLSPTQQTGLGTGLPVMMAIALDTSGSMAGEKLVRSKRACEAVVSLLRSQDRLWLAGYATDLVEVADGLPGAGAATSSVLAKIGRLAAHGVTRLDVALQWIEACLPDTPGVARVGILITDGIPTDPLGKQTVDSSPLLQMAGRLGKAGVTVCAVGLGNARNFNSALLTQISDRGRGEFLYADSPEALDKLILKKLTVSQTVAVVDAALEIERLLPGSSIRAACRYRPDYLPLEPVETALGYHLEVGLVRADVDTDILVNVEIPAQKLEEWDGARDILAVRLSGERSEQSAQPFLARLTNTHSYSEAQKRDPDIEQDRLNWDVNLYSDALVRVQEQNLPETAKMRKTGQLLSSMEQSARRAGNEPLASEVAEQVSVLRSTGKLDAHRATGLLTATRGLGTDAADEPAGSASSTRSTGVLAQIPELVGKSENE